jgi:protein-S-isoprenylcysteine O-methyltransferase Ste14
MLIGLCSLVASFFMYLAMSMASGLFVAVAICSFELILFGRILGSSRREAILLLITNAAFVAAGVIILTNPSFPSFGRWDYFVFMTLLTLAFITAGFLPFQKVEIGEYGLATAFVVSFFYEMFGFPLTLMVIDILLEKQFPLSGFAGLKAAHLWVTLGLMDYSSAHLFSGIAIVAGAVLVIVGHLTLHAGKGQIVTSGIYRYLKHPQYIGIIVITGGMLIEYPTLLGLAMWAVLISVYVRRAKQESREVALKQTRTSSLNTGLV